MNKAENIIRQMLTNTNGKFFTVGFIKRTNGERRILTGRTGVTKHLKGGTLNYDPISKGLFMCFDMQKQAYRSIPLENIYYMKIDGAEYTF